MCGADSDEEEGLFRLREVGDISNEEAAAAFSSDEEEEEEGEGTKEMGGVHMLATAGDLRPGPPMCGADWAAEWNMSRS